MGGFGTFDMGAQFPDLFARAQPTVGEETNNNVLGSFRNLPILMWNVHGDELVGDQAFLASAQKLEQLGYRVTLHAHLPCASTGSSKCSPVLPDHLELAINDWFLPAARFLGSALVNRNPPHVTFVVDPARYSRRYGIVADHAYWVSGLECASRDRWEPSMPCRRASGWRTPSRPESRTALVAGGRAPGADPLHQPDPDLGAEQARARHDRIVITASNIGQAAHRRVPGSRELPRQADHPHQRSDHDQTSGLPARNPREVAGVGIRRGGKRSVPRTALFGHATVVASPSPKPPGSAWPGAGRPCA